MPVVLEEKTLHSSMKGHVRHLLAPHFLIIVSNPFFQEVKKMYAILVEKTYVRKTYEC